MDSGGPEAHGGVARRQAATRWWSAPICGPVSASCAWCAGTALVGSAEEVAARLNEYVELGVDSFVLSGYPHLEEAIRFAELVFPLLPGKTPVTLRDRTLTGGAFDIRATPQGAGGNTDGFACPNPFLRPQRDRSALPASLST
jgi:hypothetical protein